MNTRDVAELRRAAIRLSVQFTAMTVVLLVLMGALLYSIVAASTTFHQTSDAGGMGCCLSFPKLYPQHTEQYMEIVGAQLTSAVGWKCEEIPHTADSASRRNGSEV